MIQGGLGPQVVQPGIAFREVGRNWRGYLIEGEVTVTYHDGREEVVSGGDLFYWPPGHTVRVGADAEIILFSPQVEHCAVVEHVARKLNQ